MLSTELCGAEPEKARKQRLAGLITPHKKSERFEECEYFIGRLIGCWRGLGCIAFFKRPTLHFQVGLHILMSRIEGGVTEPRLDRRGIDPRLEQAHCQ